jgi:LysM repeat protein
MRAFAIAALATLAVPAFAQEAQEGDDIAVDEAPADTGTPEPEYGGDTAKKPANGDTGGAETAPETYLVRPGDTLWNLSQRFLNNPWYWPRIWSYNQQLDNPNWIYPGSQIRFYPGSDVPIATPLPDTEDEPDFEDIAGGGFEGEGVADRFANVGSDRRRREFFVPSEQLENAGQVLNSPEEKQYLADEDRAYIKLKKQNKPGDVLQIFRPSRELRHPVTGANLGRIVEMVGEVRVDLLSREQALGTIVSCWDAVERGDYVAELPVDSDVVKATENTKNVKGYVVDAGKTVLSYLGENYIVILDKGTNDGVQVGNSFIVVRAGDPYTKEYSGLADEDIGEVLIIEASKTVSTGVLINASREIVPGDRAEMRLSR